MLPLAYPRRWQLASAVLLLLVLGAALAPALLPWLTNEAPALPEIDKWMHGITFTGLAIWFSGQYARSSYWRIAIGLLAFGVLIEVAQRAVVYRSAELMDLAADLAGITVGLLVALLGAGGWTPRLEDWLQNRFG